MEQKIKQKPENKEIKTLDEPYKVTTLKEWGPKLVIHNPKYGNGEFSFIPWDMEIEEELDELKKKAKGAGHYANLLLPILRHTDEFCKTE